MKQFGKKAISILLTATVIVGCYPNCVILADETNEDEPFFNAPKYSTGYIDSGVVAPAIDESEIDDDLLGVPSAYPSHYDDTASRGDALENTYNSKYVEQLGLTAVRDQDPFGTCWAFSAMGAVEAAALNNPNLKASRDTLNLSEWQIIYYMRNFDAKNERSKDTATWIMSDYSEKGYEIAGYAKGSSEDYALNQMMNWKGATTEDKQQYPSKHVAAAQDLRNDDYLHLSGYEMYNIKENPMLVKKAVLEHGAVTLAYTADQGQCIYFNIDNACQYDDDEEKKGGHAVDIVGWDDNYKKELFGGRFWELSVDGYNEEPFKMNISEEQKIAIENNEGTIIGFDDNLLNYINDPDKISEGKVVWTEKTGKQPSNNGAWLIRNSWGKYTDSLSDREIMIMDNGGNEARVVMSKTGTGYFWLSYEDATIQPSCYAAVVDKPDDHDNIYEYDGTIYDYYERVDAGTASFANIFKVDANNANPNLKSEIIDSVAFKVNEANSRYSVKLYGFKEGDYSVLAQPDKGWLLCPEISGKFVAAGYHEVELPNPVAVPCGSQVAVVVTLSNSGNEVRLATEGITNVGNPTDYGVIDGFPAGKYTGGCDTITDAKQGESWFMQDGIWSDLNVYCNKEFKRNFRIKMYTTSSTEAVSQIESNNQYFSDVAEKKWYNKAINDAVRFGIMKGTSDTEFSPEDDCTRTMMVTILHNMASKGAAFDESVLPFKDVKENAWYTESVKWAFENGITSGISADKFGINEELTREQVATFFFNFSKYQQNNEYEVGNIDDFRDAKEVSSWAKEAMEWAYGNKIITGKSSKRGAKLDPKGTATRAEVAQMAVNYVNSLMN